jgi:hypothetical protein
MPVFLRWGACLLRPGGAHPNLARLGAFGGYGLLWHFPHGLRCLKSSVRALVSARTWPETQILWADLRPIAVNQPDPRQGATALIRHHHRRAVLGGELVTPLLKGDQCRSKRAALLREAVERARRRAASQQDASRTEALKPIRQSISRHAKAALKLGKPLRPQESIANDEECPPVAHVIERAGERAVECREIGLSGHGCKSALLKLWSHFATILRLGQAS